MKENDRKVSIVVGIIKKWGRLRLTLEIWQWPMMRTWWWHLISQSESTDCVDRTCRSHSPCCCLSSLRLVARDRQFKNVWARNSIGAKAPSTSQTIFVIIDNWWAVFDRCTYLKVLLESCKCWHEVRLLGDFHVLYVLSRSKWEGLLMSTSRICNFLSVYLFTLKNAYSWPSETAEVH